MWNKITKNRYVKHAITIIVIGFVTYFLIAPFIISSFFPQYAILKNYRNVEICTDLPAGTPSSTFLPASCASRDQTHTIGCVYDTSHYATPANPTGDEKLLCPLFVSANDARGIKNQALAMLPIDENILHNILTVSIAVVLIAIVIVVELMIRKSRVSRRIGADEHEPQQSQLTQ
jgi:hypothetical protein